jgi:Ankyrin repeats (3 copies)
LRCTAQSYKFAAGQFGNILSLMAACELGMEYSVATMMGAAESNQLFIVQFLHGQGCPWDQTVSHAAARRGELEMLRWAHEHGCPVDVGTILRIAASSGHIEMVAWVKQQPGVVYDYRLMAIAAEQGHTAMCEYLHAEQCPWNESVYYTAARSGYVGTVRWLQEHGCHHDAIKVCQVAAMGGSIDVLMYVQQQGMVSTPARPRSMLNIAAVSEKLSAA